MKKRPSGYLMLLLVSLLLLSACSGDKKAPAQQETAPPDADMIQVDISRLSETMAYAQMFTIVTKPAEYVGQTTRVKGTYVPIQDPTREGLYYHFLVVADMQACCEIGVEFFLEGHRYPDDYPPQYSTIEVEGKFEMCSVAGQEHICLKATKMKTL